MPVSLCENICEDKTMASRSPSSKIPILESAVPSRAVSVTSIVEPSHLPVQSDNLCGPVAILWDIENCAVPSNVQPEDVSGNIRLALRVHPLIRGAVTMFSAYGDFNAFPRRLREGCQRTGVKLVDVPNGRKDAADKAILVDMFLFALDNRPPSSIMLISGDVDFALALHILGQRGYTVILIIPSGVGVSSALCNAGRFVWDWPSIARGEGFVSPKSHGTCGSDLSGHIMSHNFGDCPEKLVEDEVIDYKGRDYNSCSVSSNCREPSKVYHSFSECSNNNSMPGAFLSSSWLQCQHSGISEALSRDQNSRAHDCWVQPGDIQGLKGQLVSLLETFGGSLLLVRVSSEYLRSYGRPLYMSEYGIIKLGHLANKMADVLILVGKGPKKLLCLRNSDMHAKKYENTPIILKGNQNGKGMDPGNVPKASIVKKNILKKTMGQVPKASIVKKKVDCNGQETLKSHKQGKKHKKNLQKLQPRDNSYGLEPTVPPYLNPHYLNPGKVPKSSIVKKKILKKITVKVPKASIVKKKVDCNCQETLKSHKQGKMHKKNLQKRQDSITPKPTKAQTIAPAGTLEVAVDDKEKLQYKETKSKVRGRLPMR